MALAANESQTYLFDEPKESSVSDLLDTWQARLARLQDLGKERGGLVPRSVVHDILGVSRQRIHQLCHQDKLEVVHFFGTEFVSGRSIQQHKEGIHRQVGGRVAGGAGRKRVSLWRSIVIGFKAGQAIGDSITK